MVDGDPVTPQSYVQAPRWTLQPSSPACAGVSQGSPVTAEETRAAHTRVKQRWRCASPSGPPLPFRGRHCPFKSADDSGREREAALSSEQPSKRAGGRAREKARGRVYRSPPLPRGQRGAITAASSLPRRALLRRLLSAPGSFSVGARRRRNGSAAARLATAPIPIPGPPLTAGATAGASPRAMYAKGKGSSVPSDGQAREK